MVVVAREEREVGLEGKEGSGPDQEAEGSGCSDWPFVKPASEALESPKASFAGLPGLQSCSAAKLGTRHMKVVVE